jgi:hypothetical protein
MSIKVGDSIVYTNTDGTKEVLVAVANGNSGPCKGCVGQSVKAVCGKLPYCAIAGVGSWVWKEAAQ